MATGSADVALSQPNIDVHRRYHFTEISPATFERFIGVATSLPIPVDSIYTLFMPLDVLTWVGTAITAPLVFVAFYVVNRWHWSTETWVPSTTFQLMSISAIPLISESIPLKWFNIRATGQGKLLLFLWLPLATVLSSAYESNLLSSLVSISYEKPLETFQDVLDGQVPFYMLGKSILTPLMKYNTRPVVRQVFENNLLKYGGFFNINSSDSTYEDALDQVVKGKGCIMIDNVQQKR